MECACYFPSLNGIAFEEHPPDVRIASCPSDNKILSASALTTAIAGTLDVHILPGGELALCETSAQTVIDDRRPACIPIIIGQPGTLGSHLESRDNPFVSLLPSGLKR